MSLRADSVAAESLRVRGDSASWFSRIANTESCCVLSPRQSSADSATPAESTSRNNSSRCANWRTNSVSWASLAMATFRSRGSSA